MAEEIIFEKVRVTPVGNVSRKDAALALSVSPKTLCEWAAKGFGPRPKKIGGRVFYNWDEILAFADGNYGLDVSF